MLAQLFMYGDIPANAERGEYDLFLVLLSYIVASFSSYIALDFAGHVTRPQEAVSKRAVHFFGASVLGAGIWSMHFIGMLAYQMKMVVSYDPLLTFFSMLVAISIAYFVLDIVKAERMRPARIILGAICLGLGICAMHYSGMMAMEMDAALHYTPGLFLLSVAIAIAASAAALLIAFTLASIEAATRNHLKCQPHLSWGGPSAVCTTLEWPPQYLFPLQTAVMTLPRAILVWR